MKQIRILLPFLLLLTGCQETAVCPAPSSSIAEESQTVSALPSVEQEFSSPSSEQKSPKKMTAVPYEVSATIEPGYAVSNQLLSNALWLKSSDSVSRFKESYSPFLSVFPSDFGTIDFSMEQYLLFYFGGPSCGRWFYRCTGLYLSSDGSALAADFDYYNAPDIMECCDVAKGYFLLKTYRISGGLSLKVRNMHNAGFPYSTTDDEVYVVSKEVQGYSNDHKLLYENETIQDY